jgi:hypothetical protein
MNEEKENRKKTYKDTENERIYKQMASCIRKQKQTLWPIPTERPPLVIEVSANFCGQKESRCQRDGSLRPYSRFSGPEPLLFLPSSSTIVLARLSGPRSRHTTLQKIW